MKRARRPSLEALRIFEASARLGGFTRAADQLGLSQSAISLRIRDLQADIGVALFARTRPRIELTPEGRRLAAAVGAALAMIDANIADLRPAAGSLKLSVNPTIGRWLAPRFERFAPANGTMRVDFDVSTDVRHFLPGGPDIAIRSGDGRWPGLVAELLCEIERTPMMSPNLAKQLGDRPKPGDLLRLTLLDCDGWSSWFETTGIPDDMAVYASTTYPSQGLAAEAAAAGAGVALISPRFFQSYLDEKRLVAPFDIITSGPDGHYAVYPDAELRPPAWAFLNWLRQELGSSHR